jgi:hypothetical protein
LNTDRHGNPGHKIIELARTFPSLKRVLDELKPFDAPAFDRRASGGLSHGERVTAQFLLAVWDPDYDDWQCGRFDVMEALRVWDEPHRAAFLDWARDPWWP